MTTINVRESDVTQDDLKEVRELSRVQATQLGYTVNRALPPLDAPVSLRRIEDVATRMLCVHAISAVAHDFSRPMVMSWLKRERLVESMAPSELKFLKQGGDIAEMQCRVNALFALAWATQIERVFNFAMECPETLAGALPDFEDGSSSAFRQKVSLRSAREIVEMADLAYCLHWSIRDAVLRKQRPPGRLHPIYVIERRRALEWLIGKDSWDEVSLDA